MKTKIISYILALTIIFTFSGCMFRMLGNDSAGGMGMMGNNDIKQDLSKDVS